MKRFLSELLVIILFVNCVQLQPKNYGPNKQIHIIQKCLQTEGLPLNAVPETLCLADREKVARCIIHEQLVKKMKMNSSIYPFKYTSD
ncbi:uncharacterized protein LOC135833472 isoform X2 [Planococcus citri]|uniref:uncharacterized protein LOC135833472 isoform X2 n=1 Tax=Planococcus citri TaxID=170843 RepID=UPI0031F90BFA